jgi:oxygen-independent coproporphyrinogen-3 oxidase
MGIQSLEEDLLGRVQRRHTPEQALAACELLVGSGLIVNVDLIYGLPGQTEQSFARDLRLISERGVPAVTLYSLRINERTRLGQLLDGARVDLPKLMRWRAFVKSTAEELGYTQTRFHTFKRLNSPAKKHERLPTFDQSMSGFQLGIGMSAVPNSATRCTATTTKSRRTSNASNPERAPSNRCSISKSPIG